MTTRYQSEHYEDVARILSSYRQCPGITMWPTYLPPNLQATRNASGSKPPPNTQSWYSWL